MALFKRKTNSENAEPAEDAAFTPQPEKARKWFEHAKTAAMSSNYEYAITCYANGIKLDPGSMAAHESMFEAAVRYNSAGAKPAKSKDVKNLDDGTPVGKFAAAELEWMKDLKNAKAAIKLLETSVKAEQLEFGHWIAPRVLGLLRPQKKLTKSMLRQTMDLFRAVGSWDESMAALEMLRQLDPTDADLDAEYKNLSAQRAMDQGGYDRGGEEGDFRQFIKDADKQRELIEEESLAGGGSVEERNLSRARAAYEETPTLPDAINRYAQLLKKEADPESEQAALEVYEKGYADTNEYRFRMLAGDIRIERLQRAYKEAKAALEAKPDDETLAAARDEARRALLSLQNSEYSERVARYPTDRLRKFELGAVQYELGQYGDAMAQFQASKDEPKLRVRAGHMLGRCFFQDEWHAEAISEFQEALGAIDATERDREQSIRYDLMLALIAEARSESSVDLARQARDICSDIARRDITYRDIRARRKEVDELIKSLG